MRAEMRVDTRRFESREAAEVYVTAAPAPGRPGADQAAEVFSAVAERLRLAGARIVEERVFAAAEAMEAVAAARRRAYGALADEVPPAWLIAPPGVRGALSGVQVHAVAGPAPRAFRLGGRACGRYVALDGYGYVTLTGVTAAGAGDAPVQARAMFEAAEAALREAGADLRGVVRTWVWLGGILDWYGDFNGVRNRFYAERGLIGPAPGSAALPASTGIGVRPAGVMTCAMDAVALVGAESPRRFAAAGRQRSPYEYGSAFSRAVETVSPGGRTLFVSGTAAIDAAGQTCHPGDALAQIRDTLGNVRAVLRDAGYGDSELVQAIAYCKTPEVERAFLGSWGAPAWPCLTAIADICRPDLLFELEATAARGA